MPVSTRRPSSFLPRTDAPAPEGAAADLRARRAAESRCQTDLMLRFRETRDPSAFEALYAATQAGIGRWIVQRMASVGMDGDPAEFLQDTFVNVYRYAGTFRDEPGNSFRGWARTIAANVVRRARGRRRLHQSFQALPSGVGEPRDEREGPCELLVCGEQRESLARAWTLLLLHYAAAASKLSARDREALHLVEVEGRAYVEVARLLKVRSSNMKMIVFRSRKRIRSHMLAAFALAGAADPVAHCEHLRAGA